MQQKQIRLTLEDTLYSQVQLLDLIKLKRNASECLSKDEKETIYSLLPKALISQGTNEPFIMREGTKIITFESTQTLALRLMEIDKDFVNIKVKHPEPIDVIYPIGKMWEALYTKLLYLFPKALADAMKMSSEQLKKEQQGSFEFSPGQELK